MSGSDLTMVFDRAVHYRSVQASVKLKALLKERVLFRLDHTNFNQTPSFDEINPSAENLARFVYEQLASARPDVEICWAPVWKSPDAWATYYPTK